MYIYRFCKALFQNIKYQRILNKAYEQDEVIQKISTILGVQIRRDWIGRLYTVVNPAIRDGEYDRSQAYEYTVEGYDTTEHAKQWIINRVALVQNFLQTENLFDLLTFDVEKLDDHGNYLFTIFPITLPDVLEYKNAALAELCCLCCVGLIWGFWDKITTLF